MLTLVDISMKNYHTAGLYSLLSSIFFLQFISFKFILSCDYCGMHKLSQLQYTSIPDILNSHIMSSCIFWNDKKKNPFKTLFFYDQKIPTYIELTYITLKNFLGPQEQILCFSLDILKLYTCILNGSRFLCSIQFILITPPQYKYQYQCSLLKFLYHTL